MSRPADNDINSKAIIKHTQHPYPHPHPEPSQHGQQQYFDQIAPFNSNNNRNNNNNTHHSSTFPVISSDTRSPFNLGAPSYTAIPSAALVGQDTPGTASTVLSHKPIWNSEPEALPQQKGDLTGATQSLTTGGSSYQPDMRYLKGPLDVLNAEQYDDGRYTSHRRLAKPDSHVLTMANAISNPKKRGRKVSQHERAESVEEIKRARGRPRLETGDHQDMKERRKEQIRLAQRAYRNRKETAITDLEAKVAGLEASNAEVKATFQSLLVEYVEKHAISAQIPELGRRLQQFQAVLTQRCSEVVSPRSDKATSEVKPDDALETSHAPPESKTADDGSASQAVALPVTQQPQQLLGGIIVTHEPESQTIVRESATTLDSSLADGNYTFVKMPSSANASFSFDLDYLNNSMQTQWSLPHWGSLFMPASGAYLEKTFGRRLHRRTTERAARLLAMETPPYDTMHRVFGFVRNYASLDNIRQRIHSTLSRRADEDLNAYTQPFHHIGGSGTHFAGDAKAISYPSGAPFPNAGFGMGPFNEKTTAVRDEMLDALQHTEFPGWQGEWFDSYEVEKFLAQKSINLPQGGEGYVEIPPGDFYHNPLDDPASTKGSLQGSATGRGTSDFNISSDVTDAISIHSGEQSMVANAPYPSPVSSIDSMLSIPAATDMWPSSMGTDFLGMSQPMPSNMSSLLAYDNTSSLGFPDSSHFVYPSPTMNLVSGQTRNKRVWFSVDKFIDRLGTKSTCVGRGPAFRKDHIVVAFWEAVEAGPE
ncbi:hypothetical protein HD806DRAFT_543669 [Xylariaceae sp. AK1471]|nr:hypothetical protein HD806DRAFT_543669 [Xylariaceae sp. AK1471]